MITRTLMFGIAGLVAAGFSLAAETAKDFAAGTTGIGRPAADRGWWAPYAEAPEGKKILQNAEASLKSPMPAFDAERYLDFTKNGDRTLYQAINLRRWGRLTRLVMGECLEGSGRFVPAIEETVKSLCSDPSWVLPAHDRDARVFKGGAPHADLGVAMNGYQIALARWLLADRLAPEISELIRENVSRRLTGPVLATIDGTAPEEVLAGHFWTRANHNWNAVCTAGAVGALLATETSPETRGKAIAWASRNMDLFLSGFGADGYCSEGLGYWGYGFGHFALLAENLRTQTGGKVDLYQRPRVRKIVAAARQLEITGGVFPAFADCSLNSRPSPHLLELLDWRLDGRPFPESPAGGISESILLYDMLGFMAVRNGVKPDAAPRRDGLPASSWFADSGVCVVRPAASGGMGAAWKGGTNAEHHNHNDVGTTVVVWKGRALLADPGAMVYRAETFSKERYRLPVMGSFGHSVPVVAGALQSAGAQSRGRVVSTDFTEAAATVTMDIASAYPSAGLTKLERTWTYQRSGDGVLTVEDVFGFGQPAAFATAWTGFGDWYLIAENERGGEFLIVEEDGAALHLEVTFSGKGAWELRNIGNPSRPTVRRLGLSLVDPAAAGFIRTVIRPSAKGPDASARKLTAGMVPAKLVDPGKAPEPQ
jgi:hypothetical protein